MSNFLLYHLFLFHVIAYFAVAEVHPISNSEGCGLIDSSSFGDVRTEVPWMASIFRKSQENCSKWVLWKSGYIVGPSTVVMSGRHFWNYTTNAKNDPIYSSALPIKASDFLVGVGVLSDDLKDADFYTHYYHVESVRPHYQSFKKYSPLDIAIIHLKEPIQFNSHVKPICLSSGWNLSPMKNLSSITSAPAVKTGFESDGGFQRLYKNSIVLGDYPLKEDCDVQLKRKVKLVDLGHEDLPIKRCIDLDSGLAFKQDDRWYLASLMTGKILPDPEEEAWTFFSPVEKTYLWLQQNLLCGPLNFTCYEGKCVNLPNDTSSTDLLNACEETENKYNSIIESQEKCFPIHDILRNWCNNCTDNDSGMLDKGEDNVPTSTISPPTTSTTISNNILRIADEKKTKTEAGSKIISISPSQTLVMLPHLLVQSKASTPFEPSKLLVTSSSKTASQKLLSLCGHMNLDSRICNLLKSGALDK